VGINDSFHNPRSPVKPVEEEPKFESTAKKDVVDVISQIEDKGEKSKFLKGHISKKILEDTFLLNDT
jgi:hypothetical protein